MYTSTSLGQPQAQAACSGWESDPQSFAKVIAEHHMSTDLGQPVRATGGPHQVTKTAWRVKFPDNNIVYVTLARVPDFVVAARWYPKPAGPSRFYTYSCAPGGTPVFTERQKP